MCKFDIYSLAVLLTEVESPRGVQLWLKATYADRLGVLQNVVRPFFILKDAQGGIYNENRH